jgi:protein TonB
MAKPLRSDNPVPPNVQFSHFGILHDGSQSKASLFTSIIINVIVAVVIIIIGAAVRNTIVAPTKVITLVEPIPIKKLDITPKVIPKPCPNRL